MREIFLSLFFNDAFVFTSTIAHKLNIMCPKSTNDI